MTDDELYEYLGQVFEWDRMKAARNAIAHGVRFTEAATVFFDPQADLRLDEEHSLEEQRYTVVGRSLQARTLFVVHAIRGVRLRLISAREVTASERRQYEARLGRRIRTTE